MSFSPPVVTGYSGFWSGVYSINSAQAEADYNSVARAARSSNERRAAIALSRPGFRGMRKVMRVLNGAAAGSDATETHSRIAAGTPFQPETEGGVRALEVVTDNSGVTTTAQITYLNNKLLDLLFVPNPAFPYPLDASGNGSNTNPIGGKLS